MNNNNPYSILSLRMTQVEDLVDPGFTYPGTDVIIPSPDEEIDPDFSVMPSHYSDYPARPNSPSYYSIPCAFCNNNQWIRGGIHLLNAATGYNPLTVYIDNRVVFSGLDFSGVTQYRQLSQGYHTFSTMGSNGYVYSRKSIYVGDGTATIAIVSFSAGPDLASIRDTACFADWTSSCFWVCNLTYYSGPANVSPDNIYLNSVNFAGAASFSWLSSGDYTLCVARSARPGNILVTMPVTLNPSRIYTLYVLNRNPSADTVQTLLIEGRRSQSATMREQYK